MATTTGWKRDLTMECVESNPGPSMKEVLDLIAQKVGADATVQAHLAKLADEIKKANAGNPFLTDVHVVQFFATQFDIVKGIVGGPDAANGLKQLLDETVKADAGKGTALEKLRQEFDEFKERTEEEMAYLSLAAFQSLSHVAVYNHIEKRSGFIYDSSGVWASIGEPNEALVQTVWSGLAYHLDGTEPCAQKTVESIIPSVLDSNLNSWLQKKIADPDKGPDISITRKLDTSLTWRSLLIPVEIERIGDRHKEGVGQVISYMSSCLRERHIPSMVGVYTDGRKIEVLRLTPVQSQPAPFVYRTGLMDFLPKKKPPEAPAGFRAFVRILNANLDDLVAFKHPTEVSLGDDQSIELTDFVAFGCQSRVYKGKDSEGVAAVKILDDGRSTTHFDQEIAALHILNVADPAGRLFPLLSPRSTRKVLILRPLAKHSLRSYASEYPLTEQVAARIVGGVITALKVAHRANVVHNDIRPSNIIMYLIDGIWQPIVIDWGLALRLPTTRENVYGTLAYASSSFLQRNSIIPSAVSDLESVIYVFLFLLVGYLPWYKAQLPVAVLQARDKIDNPHVVQLLTILKTHKITAHDPMLAYVNTI